MIPKIDMGEYDLPVVVSKTGRWLTPFNKGDMFREELEFYNSDSDDAQELKKNFRLNTSGKYWKYDKREEGEIPIYDKNNVTVGYKTKSGKTIINKKRPVTHNGEFIGFYNTNNGKFESVSNSNYDNEPSVIRLNQKGRKFTKKNVSDDDFISQDDLIDMAKLKYSDKINNLRTGSRDNGDGTESTHKMAYAEENGKFVAYPTLFQEKDGSWNEIEEDDNFSALKEAKKRGETFRFNTEEEAKDFAEGSWKEPSMIEIPEAMIPPPLERRIVPKEEARRRIAEGETYNIIRKTG